jgi:hypothetical protein
MATYIFKTPGKFKKDSGALHGQIGRGPNDFIELSADDSVSYRIGPYSGVIDPAIDDITIDDAAFSGTGAELQDALIAVFPNANSGSGGSGGAPTILQSPDTTLWSIGVNDAGVLQTTQVAEGTAGTLHLFSPDSTEWNVTVNDAGALTTTAI